MLALFLLSLTASLAKASPWPPSIVARTNACAISVESCSSAATSATSCCVNKPGGQFLQTQFWDTDPVTGPHDSWTIHGLWANNCDGTYEQSCDPTRAYNNITAILQSFGKNDLLLYMEDIWQSNNNGSPESLWEHEWSKHGTCISTLEPDCLTGYKMGEEAAEYFETAVNLFKTLDTYGALKAASITPSSSKTYTSAAIQAALNKVTGAEVIIQCSSENLNQVYYGFLANGPLPNADFVPSALKGRNSNCPSKGVKYLPKNGSGSGSGGFKSTTTGTAPPPPSTVILTEGVI